MKFFAGDGGDDQYSSPVTVNPDSDGLALSIDVVCACGGMSCT